VEDHDHHDALIEQTHRRNTMKAYNNLRTMIHSTFWFQLSVAALAALLLATAIGIGLARLPYPVVQAPAAPRVRLAVPALRNPNVPISGTGSAYDGGAYGTVRPATHNPNVPISGTGSAYNGGAYGTRPAARNPNVPISGTGSAYNGGAYGALPATP
jgi:hypothetical protein